MAPKRALDNTSGESSISTGPSPKRLKFSTSSMPVKVTVGTGIQAKDFYIHQDVLIRHSDFFKAALSNDWREAGERVVRLPEDEPEVFDCFADFVYSGQLAIPQDTENLDDSQEPKHFIKCWLFGDKILSDSFRDAATDGLGEWVVRADRVDKTAHRSIYSRSSKPSGLKRLLVDIAVFDWGEEAFKTSKHSSAWGAFFADTTLRALEIATAPKKGGRPYVRAACRYHDHGDKKPCYKTMF